MRHYGHKILVLHFCLTLAQFCSVALHAQDNSMKFERFGTENGLSSNIVYSIFQDSKGFLWIGTNDGLNRYDGYKFQVYRFNPKDSNSLSGNFIQGVIEDPKGFIWVGTTEGLCRLDPQSGKIKRVRLSVPGKGIGLVGMVTNEELMIHSSGSLLLVNINNGEERMLTGLDSPLQSFHIHTNITSDKFGNLYFVVNTNRTNKIFKYDRQQKTIGHYKTLSRTGIIKEMVRSFFIDSRNYNWVDAGHGTELFHYPATITPEDFHSLKPVQANSSTINHFYEDRAGYIWMGTAKGLLRYDYPGNKISEVFYREPGVADITNIIYEDNSGIIWVGSYSGLYKMNPGVNKFSHFTVNGKTGPRLAGDFILGLNTSSDQRIWINYDWGLKTISLLDISNSTIEHYSYSHPIIREYLRDGVKNQKHIKKEDFDNWYTKFTSHLNANPGSLPYLMVVDDQQRIWRLRGNKIDRDGGAAILLPGDVVDIAYWNQEILVATNGSGLMLINTMTGKLSRFSAGKSAAAISGDNLSSVLVEENGNAWIGTHGAGLNYFDRGKQTFTHYTIQNGLCNNSIFSMVKDNKGRLWLGTGNGLSCFDISNNKFTNFFRSNGLINTEFNRYSALKLPDGKFLMGGMHGIDYFDPDQVLTEAYKPPVQITGFKVYNESILPGPHLSLAHNKNYITIEFAAMDFRNPAANSFAYKLEGIDKDWIAAGNKTSVSYATLSPGRYHFRVKAAGSDGAWNEESAEVFFTIRTPWWRSGLFWSLAVILAGSILYGIYRFRIRQLKKIFAVRTKISQDLHDEVGATLTSISYLSEVAKLHSAIGQPGSHEAIDKIGEFSRDMIGEMNDIVWAINPANDKFEKIESRMRNFASVLLATKNIQFNFSTDEKISNNFLGMQQRKNLYLIFKEAINNAAKYSDCSMVCVKIWREDHHILMDITDNGKGFEGNGNGQGNGLKNMKARAIEIDADLAIEPIPGDGTRIRLSVPLTQNTY